MRKPEQRLWDAFRRAAPPSLWLQRIENAMIEGMPDVLSVADDNHVTWVEMKVADVPARQTTRLLGEKGLSQEQKNWHKKYAAYGCISYVLIRDSAKALYFIPGVLGDLINDASCDQLRVLSVASDWSGIIQKLGQK